MKLLTAIIRPEKLDDAMAAVTDAGAGGLTVTQTHATSTGASARTGKRCHALARSLASQAMRLAI